MRLGIAVATAGYEEMLLACLRSIRKNCGDVPVHVTYDGAEPEDLDALRDLEMDLHYTVLGVHSGISTAWNTSITACLEKGCDYVAVLNDDLEVHKDFDRLYLDFLARHPEVRIACSFDRLTGWSILPEINQRFSKAWGHDKLPPATTYGQPGGIYGKEGFEAFAEWVKTLDHPEFLRGRMNGACFVMSRQCFVEDGPFPEEIGPPGTHEDLWVWMTVLTKHGPDAMGSLSKSFVNHIRAATISSYPRQWAESRVAENSARYRRRWPREQWGDIEDYFSKLNATPADQPEPRLPRPRWW